jgi:hypothetical protein
MTISIVNVRSGEANAANPDRMLGILEARRPQLPAGILTIAAAFYVTPAVGVGLPSLSDAIIRQSA